MRQATVKFAGTSSKVKTEGRGDSGVSYFATARQQDEESDSAYLLANASNDFVSLELDTPKAGGVSSACSIRADGGASAQGKMAINGISSKPPSPTYSEDELRQTDRMINHMLLSYVSCLILGWGLLFFDWALNEVEKHPKAEPWINDAVTIGGASAVLSPIIQWGHTIVFNSRAETETAQVRRRFYVVMWIIYVSIVGLSTLVAIIRFAMGEDGSLHHFISTTSNHLVLARISASLINWGSGKLFIQWYRAQLASGPLF